MENRAILMVEDSPEDFAAATRAFARAGMRNELILCEDGRSALDYLHRRGRFADPATSPRPALILLDLNLPRVDGEANQTNQTISEGITHATRDLRAQNAELVRSNADLDDFAHIVSHDLKEPLRGIHNYSSFLLEDVGDAVGKEARSQLETLVRLSRRLETLIDDLLYYSRVGRTEISRVESSVQEIAEGAVQKLADFLAGRQATVRFESELPVAVCDPVRIGEVFQNLVVNAVKYNDSPDKRIEIGVLPPPQDAEEEGKASPPAFFVRDNGIGIRDNEIGQIFRPFKRLHGRESYGGGSGVGLSITKKLVERHGGRIWVESVPGVGTTFFFTVDGTETTSPSTEEKDDGTR